jgi:small subunit ribosomal protein S16
MSTRIRLRRMGANKRPFYRVVVADQRSPRDGRFIENIGKYHPLEDPSLIEIDEDRALHWLRVGAQPSNQVRNLMDRIGIWDKFAAERPNAAIPPKPGRADKPVKEKLSKKKAATKAAAATKVPAERPTKAAPAAEEPAAETAPVEAPTTPEPAAPEPSIEEPTATVEESSASVEPVEVPEDSPTDATDAAAAEPEPASTEE